MQSITLTATSHGSTADLIWTHGWLTAVVIASCATLIGRSILRGQTTL